MNYLDENEYKNFIRAFVLVIIATVVCIIAFWLAIGVDQRMFEKFSQRERLVLFGSPVPYIIPLLIAPVGYILMYHRFFRQKRFPLTKWRIALFAIVFSPIILAPATYWIADAVFENAGYHRCTDHNLLHNKGAPLPYPIDPRVWVLDKAICKVP